MCFGKVVFVFNVSLEELLGEHNLNAEDFKKVRFELKKYFDMTKKKKKKKKKKKRNLKLSLKTFCFSTLFRYIIFYLFFLFLLLVYIW